EIGVLIHYDILVFEPTYDWRKQWGYQPDPEIFNPINLDTDQWVRTAKAAGAKYAILVAKHCSGFSLWPTEAHEYSVKSSPWRDGQGDIVKDFIQSCKKYNIRPGLYYSTSANAYYQVENPGVVLPEDESKQKQYDNMVIQQLTELWTHYGELFEIWFDGGALPPEAGGPDVKSLLKKTQPQAVCFQGPKEISSLTRWAGNESGYVNYPCWSTTEFSLGQTGEYVPLEGSGSRDGTVLAPAEVDVPNRKNSWFWRTGETDLLLKPEELLECYEQSVGRNSNLLIGMVIDDNGLVPKEDVDQFTKFGELVHERFENQLAKTTGEGDTITIKFTSARVIDQVVIMENIKYGENIQEYHVEGYVNGRWQILCDGMSIGHKRIQRFPAIKVSTIK